MTDLATTLQSGQVAIIRTDTLYGVVARADDEAAVERVFQIKSRDRDKPLIVLLPDAEAAYDGASVVREYASSEHPTTVIVDSPHAPAWLRHADGSVGYRVPQEPGLHDLLMKVGPLVAPSANPQGDPPARTIDEARAYFGNAVDHYEDGGKVSANQPASAVIRINENRTITQLR